MEAQGALSVQGKTKQAGVTMTGFNARKVLIAGGDRLVRSRIKELLDGMDWQTEETGDLDEAMYLADTWQPDMILLDVDRRRGDVFELYKSFRESCLVGDTPILLVMGGGREEEVCYTGEDIAAAFDVRAPEAIVERPVDPGELLTSILGILG
ncbi:MAG TPA: hypothetical protein PKN23_14035 [Candidatus Hydrogenedentes bacterium]|nr:hypothetical protein [Candidatus Hydrogenedentota bacterium]HOH51412.1 hypothetical protein [Candidatus Hydrogenedentota bacterium]